MAKASIALLLFCVSIGVAAAAPVASGSVPSGNALQTYSAIVAASPTPAIDNSPFLTQRGLGYDGVAALIVEWPTGSFLCTGSLISGRDILTAAHCLADDFGVSQATSISAYFFPDPSGTLVYTTTQYVVHPNYSGDVIDDNDIALVRLAGFVDSSLDRYDLYGGPLTTDPVEFVGFGQRGGGNTGATQPAGLRRRGFNQFELIDGAVLVADFDSGLAQNDAFCRTFDLCAPGDLGLGLGAFESLIAGGDSGGPAFFNGQIVGVASFGATAGVPGGDIDTMLNTTFGEFSGHVYTGFHRDFVRANVVPEPGTWLLMLSSTVVLGAGAALRRKSR